MLDKTAGMRFSGQFSREVKASKDRSSTFTGARNAYDHSKVKLLPVADELHKSIIDNYIVVFRAEEII